MGGGRVVSVVGAGAMGGQIAHQAALHGYDVHLVSRKPERLQAAREESARLLRRRVVRGPHTSDDAVQRAMEFARSIGKTPVLVAKEAYGFVANRILFIAMQEAMRLVEGGYVSVDDCDLAVHNALGWPMGPFALADLVGLDVVEAILAEGHQQTGEERWAPLAILRDRVAEGHL